MFTRQSWISNKLNKNLWTNVSICQCGFSLIQDVIHYLWKIEAYLLNDQEKFHHVEQK